jgi:modulator of FtsH protease
MNSYSVENWTDLYVAVMGSAAALTGLLFISVSVNLDRVLKIGGAPERGLESLILMLGLILLSIRVLIPQGDASFAEGIIVLAVGQIVFVSVMQQRRYRATARTSIGPLFVFNIVTNQLPAVLILLGGVSLMADTGGGMYWLSAAVVSAMIAYFANSWVLLVEIVR